MTVLVFAAHPDDEVLGCGGTIARLAQEGNEVYVAILGEGITSRYRQREQADQALVEALHARCHQVGELLGAREVLLHDLPDNRFDVVPLLDVIKIAEDLIADLQPLTVYTHCGADLNIDHVVVHRAVLTATRPLPGCSVREVLTFEVPSSTEWAFGQFAPSFEPNVFVDISTTLETKVRAMALYESEDRESPHPRSPESLRALARRRGSTVGVGAAEAFSLVRSLR